MNWSWEFGISRYDVSTGNDAMKFGFPRHHFTEVESTNQTAKELVKQGAHHGALVSADHQAAGRGRTGRKWYDQQGKNLLLTYIVKPGRSQEQCSLLPLLVSLATADMMERATQTIPRLKWPNDIFLGGKKIGGVLLEGLFSQDEFWIVCGVGLNVNQDTFEDRYRTAPTSLKLQTGREYDREHLIEHLNDSLSRWFEVWRRGEDHKIVEQWKKRTFLLGEFVYLEIGNARLKVKVVDIDDSGALVILTHKGERETVFAGDITSLRKQDEQ